MDDGQPLQPLTARIVRDTVEWDAIHAAWDRLCAASPTNATSLSFVWLRNWWAIYGPIYGSGGLRVITLWRGSVLIGALPLYIASAGIDTMAVRCLRFLSTGEQEFEEICPDYLDLLHLPGEEASCVAAAWSAIRAMDWDILELIDLPRDSPLLRGLDCSGEFRRTRISTRGGCPIAHIECGFETYLAKLSSKTRMRARQEIRKAEQCGVTFEIATEADGEAYFNDLIRLHQLRWTADGKPGCFAAPRFTEFHRRLLLEWLKSGRMVLARLSFRGEAFVVLYGFITDAKFDLYQLGVTPVVGSTVRSPGTLANLLLMSRLVELGVTRYDFLRGGSEFKKSLTSEHREVVCLRLRRLTSRALLDQSAQLARRVVGKVARLHQRRPVDT